MSEEQKSSAEPVPASVMAPAPMMTTAPANESVKVCEPLASINDFKKFRIVVAQIKEAELHPNADKLYVLKVDAGGELRQVVAGIKRSYTPEQLIGKRVVLIANLEPAIIRGVESRGMLLAASDDAGVSLLTADRDVILGSTVK